MKKNHIMAVDDDVFTISLYNMIAEWSPHKGYFRAEKNASVALDILSQSYNTSAGNFPDYILLDIRMPEMDGFEFIQKFERKFPGRKDKTRFIITTSSVIQSDKDKASGYDSIIDFMVKPIPCDFIDLLITEGYRSSRKYSEA